MSAIPMQIGTWMSTQWNAGCATLGTLTSAGLAKGHVVVTAIQTWGQHTLQACSGSLGAGLELAKQGLHSSIGQIQNLWSMAMPAMWKVAAFLRTSTGMACSGSGLVLCSSLTAMYSENKVIRAAAIVGTIAGGALLGIAALQAGIIPACVLAAI